MTGISPRVDCQQQELISSGTGCSKMYSQEVVLQYVGVQIATCKA